MNFEELQTLCNNGKIKSNTMVSTCLKKVKSRYTIFFKDGNNDMCYALPLSETKTDSIKNIENYLNIKHLYVVK